MKHFLPTYLIRLFLLLIISNLGISLHAQEFSPHRQGELILMLNQEINPEAKIQVFNTNVELFWEKTLSKRMNIHLYRYETSDINESTVLKLAQSLPQVQMAQFNHILDFRGVSEIEEVFPNDPQFETQWSLHNTGQSGGLEDADVDAPEAWEITTGGTSSHGDDIVIAVIDEGMDINHEDLNLWKNEAEIPDNGIDDDGNGFVDDYHGWNAQESTPNLEPRRHAVHIAGTISAIGNNEIGVTGINWDTKVMPIQGTSSNEATLMEAYGYVLEMRKRYNESGGGQGAFVVATNSSFGINNGQAEDFPIWCALYDSLGHAGILNVAATANASVNVDLVGDVPATCSSDFLIIATNTNRVDELNSGAAYGSTYIDIGAPGTQILSTLPDNNYGFSTGTSMAAPHVTAAIGLLMSGACPSLMSQYKNNPTETLLLIKDFILNGVDTLPDLEGRTVSGGRLNLHKSLLLVQEYCNGLSDCVIPYSLRESQKTDISVRLNWAEVDAARGYQLEFKTAGAPNWTSVSIDTNYLDVLGLQPCSTYEYRVRTICEGDTSDFSNIRAFTSEGCCDPPAQFSILETEENSVALVWRSVFAALEYQLEYQKAGMENWTEIQVSDTSSVITGLENCTAYNLRIKTICALEESEYSDTLVFRTLGCGFCIDTEYCEARGQRTEFEWIDKVEIGPLVNESGNDQGYRHFDMPSWELFPGISYPIQLTPGFESNPFTQHWRIWIDLNQDGDFEDEQELIFSLDEGSNQVVDSTIMIPFTAALGNTRMRIAMKANDFSTDRNPLPCEAFEFGEVEDYCIDITRGNVCFSPNNLVHTLNTDNQVLLSWEDNINLENIGYILQIRELGTQDWTVYTAEHDSLILSNLLECTQYEWQVQTICTEEDSSAFSEPKVFLTLGCGPCVENNYCISQGLNTLPAWIQTVSIDGDQRTSENNNGYGAFLLESFELTKDSIYPIALIPGYEVDIIPEYWRIWIDWNQDGEFDVENELAFDSEMAVAGIVQDSLRIPADALIGPSRMRISMKDISDDNTPPEPCDEFAFGEVEDYCINISPPVNIDQKLLEEIDIYPNPFIEELHIQSPRFIHKLRLINVLGESILKMQPNHTQVRLSTLDLPSGMYVLQLEVNGGLISKQIIKQ